MKYLLLLLIIGIKILLTELFGVSLVFLSFLIKGKFLTHKRWNSKEWNTYFVNCLDSSILKWGAASYLISSVFAGFITYVLFCLFDFQYPAFCAVTLFVSCTTVTSIRYHRKEKTRIIEKLSSIRQTAKEELEIAKVESFDTMK